MRISRRLIKIPANKAKIMASYKRLHDLKYAKDVLYTKYRSNSWFSVCCGELLFRNSDKLDPAILKIIQDANDEAMRSPYLTIMDVIERDIRRSEINVSICKM